MKKQIIQVIAFLVMMMSLHSCGTRTIVQPVPVEYNHYDKRDSIRLERDTLILRDSVIIDRGKDTVVIREVREVERLRTVEVEKRKADSVVPPNFEKLKLPPLAPLVIDPPRSSLSNKILSYGIAAFLLLLILIIALKIKL